MRAIARGPRRIDLEQLCRLPSFVTPAVSCSGTKVAFYWDTTGRLELHVLDLTSGKVSQITHGEAPRAVKFPSLVWDRDDRAIVFHRDHEGDEQHELFMVELESGRVTQLTRDSGGWQIPIEFSPDNQWLSVVSGRAHPDRPGTPGQLNLWRLRRDGSAYLPVTDFAAPVGGGQWSHDGDWLAVSSNEDDDLNNLDAYVVRADGSGLRKVFSGRRGSQDAITAWHPDGKRVAVVSDASGTSRVGILDLQDQTVRWLTPDGVDEGSAHFDLVARFSPDGRMLLTVRNHESQAFPVVYDLESGTAQPLTLPGGVTMGCDFSDQGRRVLVLYSTDTTRPSFLSYDLQTATPTTILAAEYGAIDPGSFTQARHVYYPSADGTRIPALLYAPEVGPGERLPAIVHIHGGPTAQWMRGFDPFAQFLVDRGFVVLEPNIRGSTGYGVAFRDAALHDWGGRDLEDVAAGVQYLKTIAFVDPGRMVVFGGSYGGFMTFMALTRKPELWHAGIAWVGITDLKAMYEVSQPVFQYFLRQQMGDPEANAALWADRSAINFAQDLKAKLLMVHGANDARCPVDQSRCFRDRLLELGRKEGQDFEYVEFADEGHGSNDITQKIRTFQILGDYLDHVL